MLLIYLEHPAKVDLAEIVLSFSQTNLSKFLLIGIAILDKKMD
ncbi:hypothetical protein N5923_14645 [Erwiniaceae bacterium BAC15a-03b]|uniref:Uncharacterized protein n=1 Tax=Winslowiella arboricola TaxID=2978220 RepID=A0A9J6PKA1_9GAMM|nr:hypothetical protein [Winslowiella arboricola]MCU5778729.1 hypothetical protein [Winslowiella arboricola]